MTDRKRTARTDTPHAVRFTMFTSSVACRRVSDSPRPHATPIFGRYLVKRCMNCTTWTQTTRAARGAVTICGHCASRVKPRKLLTADAPRAQAFNRNAIRKGVVQGRCE